MSIKRRISMMDKRLTPPEKPKVAQAEIMRIPEGLTRAEQEAFTKTRMREYVASHQQDYDTIYFTFTMARPIDAPRLDD